uniref:Pumilio n=1 Tax=Globodera pallida TaxID=36090 RepID=A0A183CU24_GLOPA
MPDSGGCLPEAFRTPDLGLHHRQLQQQISADSESPMEVPLAAPPYQRMASLPPMLPASGQQQHQQQQPGTSFGTLQRSQPHQNVVTLAGNDYTAFVRSNGQPYQQQQQQQQQAMLVQHHHQQPFQQPMVNIGTLSRSYNAGGQQHVPPPASANGDDNNGGATTF